MSDDLKQYIEASNVRYGRMAKSLQKAKNKNKLITDIIQDQTIFKIAETQQLADPFSAQYISEGGVYSNAGLRIVEPLISPQLLRRIPLENNILLQCIECYVNNIEGTGYTLEYIGKKDDTTQESGPSQAEYRKLKAFLDSPNEEYSLTELKRRMRDDRETLGYSFMEVIRNRKGDIHAIYHIPASTMRITIPESKGVQEAYTVKRGDETVTIDRLKYWRRYVQVQQGTNKYIYFKEFGDKRAVDCEDGIAKENIPEESLATEVIMFSNYKSGYIYGLPRWINQLPSILGSRDSELVNLGFFKKGGIPAMTILVSGGYLSQDAVDAIAKKFNTGKAADTMHDILILEAQGDVAGADAEGRLAVPRLEIKPLTSEQHKDGLFQEYDANCRDKIRCAFRLPPILLGLTTDFNRATAESSVIVCESQVFGPERNIEDDAFNKYILGDGVNNPVYWKMKSNPTRIVDQADIADSITTLEDSGALTPNTVIHVTNAMFGLDIKQIDQPWGDYPYSMVLELIKQKTPIQGMEDLIDTLQQETNRQLALDMKQPSNNQDNKNNQDNSQDNNSPQNESKKKIILAMSSMSSNLQNALEESKDSA